MEDCAIVAGEEAALIVGFALVTEGVVHEDFYFAIFAGLWMGEAKAAGEVFGGVGACVAIMGKGEEFHGVGFVVTGGAQGELVGVAIDLKAGREEGGGGDFFAEVGADVGGEVFFGQPVGDFKQAFGSVFCDDLEADGRDVAVVHFGGVRSGAEAEFSISGTGLGVDVVVLDFQGEWKARVGEFGLASKDRFGDGDDSVLDGIGNVDDGEFTFA